ncbi:hypothetical protein EPK99_02680 [Neorhizobium lilium]|uniref:CMD domain protein n=1 Tax=Neorhizobium lilium TaxID=2503024 RepID=A0A444LLM3_9HYPH|nr:hypothetical protein [Neorhizobium lilium]RWX81246.1 hypothetical protein EPK99_02680 [Neorhizobium lilium]
MDQIDILSGLEPASETYRARRERPEFVSGAELCRKTVLTPQNGFEISHAMRAALAARMARFIGREDLARTYDLMLDEAGINELLTTIAAAGDLPEDLDAFTVALVRQADLVTKTPRDSSRADIERLQAAGLSSPQIIALSELIAFVNFEARVIVGLSILELVA